MSYGSATIIERIIERLTRTAQSIRIKIFSSMQIITRRVNYVEGVQKIGSMEDAIVSLVKSIGMKVQRLQCSLEDSLSALSLILELLSSLSIIIVLVILWLSP